MIQTEISVWLSEIIVIDHSARDKNSHILKHQNERKHPCPPCENFKYISINLRNNLKKKETIKSVVD